MKLQTLLEKHDHMAEALAKRLVGEVEREVDMKRELQQVIPDEGMIHNDAMKRLKEFTRKVEAEIYHLVYS
jgi:hypothetical protein